MTKVILPNKKLSRRGVLAGGAAAAGTTLATPALAALGGFCPPKTGGGGPGTADMSAMDYNFDYSGSVPEGDGPPDRGVLLYSVQLKETYNEMYCIGGEFVPDAVEKFNYWARDWRSGTPTTMDPGLLDIIYKLKVTLGVEGTPFNCNSAYRTPESNASVNGAKNSYHMKGKAMDITHPHKPPPAIYGAGMALKMGGVGKYNTFTHVDTAGFRTWNG